MIPEDARFDNISKVEWLTVDSATLCTMTNKQFLDTMLIKTQNNHELLRFCRALVLFTDRSNKNTITTFKNG